jgi:5-hydroxyisourate hydrolase-like protein (transthyretin family)
MDLKGNLLLQEFATNNKGLIQKTMDVSKLPSGVYIVRFNTGKESGNVKLVIAK